jgi:hypothetical protein
MHPNYFVCYLSLHHHPHSHKCNDKRYCGTLRVVGAGLVPYFVNVHVIVIVSRRMSNTVSHISACYWTCSGRSHWWPPILCKDW